MCLLIVQLASEHLTATIFKPIKQQQSITHSNLKSQMSRDLGSTAVHPLFDIAPVQFQTEISNISWLDVSNDILVIAFKNNAKIFRIDLNNPETINSIELPFKKNYQEVGYVERFFQDPTGTHLIATTSRRETFYINSQSTTQFKNLSELKNLDITAVAWNYKALTSSNTGSILIGDRSGGIHEAFLEFQPSSKKYFKSICKNIYTTGTTIDGISITYNEVSGKFTVVVVSADDISYWNHKILVEKPIKYNDLYLNQVFTLPPIENEKYESCKNIGFNVVKFANGMLNSKIGWLIDSGVVFGDITEEKVAIKKNLGELKFLVNLELPQSASNQIPSASSFQAIALTRYHLVLLRGNEILLVNKFNDELVFHQSLPMDKDQGEKFIGLSSDELKQTYWVFSDRNIYEITVSDEDKFIWSSMLENNMFDEALEVTKNTENVQARDVIYSRKAEHLFQVGKFKESAKVFAMTSSPSFESIALKFLELDDINALQTYFLAKFANLKSDKNLEFKVALTLLSSWIVENYVVNLNELDEQLENPEIKDVQDLKQLTAAKLNVSKEIQLFITDNIEYLDQKTIYEIIIANNRTEELIYFANLIKDYDFVVTYWIRLEKYNDVLDTLAAKSTTLNDMELIYKYSTVLLLNTPEKTINTWLDIPKLDPARLLPAILKYNEINKKVTIENHKGIEFLSKYLKQNKEDVESCDFHDTLLYLLISNDTTANDENLILRYLEEAKDSIKYNADFVLRLCLRFKRVKSAIMIYSSLSFYEDAINLALSNDLIDDALLIADKVDDDKTRKFLYLKIAKIKIDKIQPSQNLLIKDEVRFLLERCDNLLTIKDLLPILPNFTTIDNFKDEICQDLEKFGNLINKLNYEMETNVQINHDIVGHINSKIVAKSMVIQFGASCSSCQNLLASRKFFTFHCHHSFHSDCLIKLIIASDDFKTKRKLEVLQKKYLTQQQHQRAGVNAVKFVNHSDVDDLLCEKCPLCSDLRIDQLDVPLVENLSLNNINEDDWDV